MDAFLGYKISSFIQCHYKVCKSQDIFDIRLKEESHIHLGWLEGE